MFKAEDLASLAVKMLNVDAETIYGSIDSNYEKIISHLMSGNPWLVPHDADHDHRPVIILTPTLAGDLCDQRRFNWFFKESILLNKTQYNY